MEKFLGNFLTELGLFSFLGVLYYYYQKRKILNYEKNKGPVIMGYVLHSCLAEKGDQPSPELDSIIEAIDDYLHNKSATPPSALLKTYARSSKCSPELKEVIEEGLREIDG